MQTILLQNIAIEEKIMALKTASILEISHEWQKLQQSLDNQKIYAKGPLEITTHRTGYSQKMDHRRLNNFI
jgi:hypothetical protein